MKKVFPDATSALSDVLRDDITTLRGWWRNRVSRVLLVFIFSTLGSAAGTYVAGFRIVGRLVA